MRATAVVGAQAGSEGKGAVVAAIADHYNVHVRTGGPNAGHTFYHEGEKWVARGLPCGWINPEAKLVIGPGAVLDWRLLLEEIEAIEAAGYYVRDRLYIDPRAVCVTEAQHRAEGGTEGLAHQRIGSTGEGVGLARVARINRRALLAGPEFRCEQVGDVGALGGMRRRFGYQEGDRILLEGTQGSKLSLTHGPWPFVTSADTNAAQLLADAGLPPGCFEETVLVARTFPIRVAGQSGPLPNETTWEALGLPPETTTVTGKVRRVARWDAGWVRDAVALNSPASLVITFLDYIDPGSAGVTEWDDLSQEARAWVASAERDAGATVVAVGTGPDSIAFRFPWQVER